MGARACSARTARVTALVLAACLLVDRGAHAQALDGDGVEHLYQEGRAARERGELERSLELLQKAWSLRKSHDVAASLAQVEYEIGSVRDAAEHLAYACDHLPAGADPERVARLLEALAQIKREVVTLELSVEPNTAAIALNGETLGPAVSLPKELFADPGTITVTAALDGYARWANTLRGRAGEVKPLRVRLEKLEAARTVVRPSAREHHVSPDRSEVSERRQSTIPALVSASVAGAALVSGVGFWLLADARGADAKRRLSGLSGDNRCGDGSPHRRACAEVRDDLHAERTYRGVAYASFATSAAGAALSYLLWPRKERNLAVGASLTTSAAWAVAEGRF